MIECLQVPFIIIGLTFITVLLLTAKKVEPSKSVDEKRDL